MLRSGGASGNRWRGIAQMRVRAKGMRGVGNTGFKALRGYNLPAAMMRIRPQISLRLNAFPTRFGVGLAALLMAAGPAGHLLVADAHGQTPARRTQPAVKPAPAKPAAPAPAEAQTQQVDDRRWRALADQAEDLMEKGDFPGGERIGQKVVEEARLLFGENHLNMAASLSILGGSRLKQGKYPEAETAFRQALAIYEVRSGADTVSTASALNNLALVLGRRGDYAGAEGLLRRSHRILDKALGPNNADTATTLSNLGRVLDSQGKFGAGSALVAAGKPPASGSGDPMHDNPQLLVAQAEALVSRGDYGQAETLHDRVVAIYERTLGPTHPLTATGLSNLGNVRYLQGKFAEAEAVHRRALAIREKVLGPEHPDTATSLNNLANIQFEQGKDVRASATEQRARERIGQRVQSVSEVGGL
ncbi:MAG: tetratricopeptide repeat protein, partial [Betaproteobacteria bacterium]|nr:tetratricopeptide repeat protein [Betaproteobacteria bacterium]